MPALSFTRLHREAVPPVRSFGESAAWDLSAFTMEAGGRTRTLTLAPRASIGVPTGLALRAPSGSVLLICSRASFAIRSVLVANSPGIVDPDYIGEIRIILYNGGLEPHFIRHGDRIAQALIVPLTVCDLVENTTLQLTERGTQSFERHA